MNIKKLRELKKNKKGFTLIEIIVVVIILAVLLAVAVPSVLSYLDEADNAKYMAQARAVMTSTQAEVVKAYAPDKKLTDDEIKAAYANVVATLKSDGVKVGEVVAYKVAPTVEKEGKMLKITGGTPLAADDDGTAIAGYSCKIGDNISAYIVTNGSVQIGEYVAP